MSVGKSLRQAPRRSTDNGEGISTLLHPQRITFETVAICAGAALGLIEVEGFVAEWGVIQALQGVWHGPLCSDGRSMGEDGAALPGQARRSGPDRDGWAAVSGGGAVDCPHEQPLA